VFDKKIKKVCVLNNPSFLSFFLRSTRAGWSRFLTLCFLKKWHFFSIKKSIFFLFFFIFFVQLDVAIRKFFIFFVLFLKKLKVQNLSKHVFFTKRTFLENFKKTTRGRFFQNSCFFIFFSFFRKFRKLLKFFRDTPKFFGRPREFFRDTTKFFLHDHEIFWTTTKFFARPRNFLDDHEIFWTTSRIFSWHPKIFDMTSKFFRDTPKFLIRPWQIFRDPTIFRILHDMHDSIFLTLKKIENLSTTRFSKFNVDLIVSIKFFKSPARFLFQCTKKTPPHKIFVPQLKFFATHTSDFSQNHRNRLPIYIYI